ncbi:unnamed protein product [Eruca vesicaria subsp. sativa]|uniref:Uncharacterized protein n=1 Tax=Eruca vesicaria subsp. sativa TaxID=29727 RepID=A0ABC8MA25_ERUVS|nr:unnamed protein product [Eruca vesicaria subsp. sativa]
MGRLFRVLSGNWKRNRREHWHFLPAPGDNPWTMYVEEADYYQMVEGAIREVYGLGEATPVIITYGRPDWMLFSSGNIPPLTLSTSHDLHDLLTGRPWVTEVTLLVTIGARSVAEYNFLRRSNFSIGTTTYVVDGAQDDRARAIFEGLVFSERLLTSERVMLEIFGEQEMQLLYRVAQELQHVDRGVGFQGASTSTAAQEQEVPNNVSQAPSVLWDVEINLVNYSAFIDTDRELGTDPIGTDFWRDLMEEEAKATEILD